MELIGVASVGSMYTFGLEDIFQEEPDATLEECVTPMDRGVTLADREQARTMYAVMHRIDSFMETPGLELVSG